MYKKATQQNEQRDSEIVYSPSDLMTYMVSPYASWMDHYYLLRPDGVSPDEQSSDQAMVAERGMAHEQKVLHELREHYTDLVEVPSGDRVRAAERTQQAGPMQQLPTVVSEYFQQLTNGAYSEITMVERVPTTASGSVLRDFDVKRLSQGTKTSLALATRLALAHAYLAGRSGVIMLDDPCVDMDPERRKAAMSLLDDIGTTHQVVLFTCN